MKPAGGLVPRLLAACCVSVGLGSSAAAADRATLERVRARLMEVAAPWCERAAELDASGVRRCVLSLDVIPVRGAHAAASGRSLVVTNKLLEDADEDQLALILGHEVAHVVLGHARAGLDAEWRRGAITQRTHAQLDSLLAQQVPPPHADTPAERPLRELDADALGLVLAGLAGFRVRAAASLYASYLEWNLDVAAPPSAAPLTHPELAVRGAAALERARRFCAVGVASLEARLQPPDYRRDELAAIEARAPRETACAGLAASAAESPR